jgi:hypothetical protein
MAIDVQTIINQLGGPEGLQSLAQRVGLQPEQVQGAIGALTQHLQAGGAADPAQAAPAVAGATGLGADQVQSLIQTLLTQLQASGVAGGLMAALQNPQGIMAALDADKDGNALDDIAGMAGKLFGDRGGSGQP